MLLYVIARYPPFTVPYGLYCCHGFISVPFPVEYKRGKPKMDDCDKVQLCAQAICLEEMVKVEGL